MSKPMEHSLRHAPTDHQPNEHDITRLLGLLQRTRLARVTGYLSSGRAEPSRSPSIITVVGVPDPARAADLRQPKHVAELRRVRVRGRSETCLGLWREQHDRTGHETTGSLVSLSLVAGAGAGMACWWCSGTCSKYGEDLVSRSDEAGLAVASPTRFIQRLRSS